MQQATNSLLFRTKTTLQLPKTFLTLGIIFNLCLLGIFKYTDFFLENFNLFSKLFHLDFTIPLPHILLPLALSFVTFQQIAFLVDCYKQVKDRVESTNDNVEAKLTHLASKQDSSNRSRSFTQGGQGGLNCEVAPLIPLKIPQSPDDASRVAHKCATIDCMDFANAKYQKTMLDSSKAKSPKEIPHINFLDYCLFITFFPQLIAGPIVHHKEMMPQFYAMTHPTDTNDVKPTESKTLQITIADNKPSIINWEYIAKGLFIFSIGLFKKVVIADSFAKWANAGSKAIESGVMLNFFESWATALSHMFEYYFDFSGYCDMAIGLGLLFGIILPVNFNSPFKSLSISEFWRRWHITLGRFLKHYVYIPLGGSRVPLIFNLRNLFLVFLISGLWHGAGFGFIIWGSIHGLSVVIHKLYTLLYKKLDSANLYIRFMKN